MTAPTDDLLFSKDGVTVTPSRFVIGNKTYAIQNITSFRHEIERPPRPRDDHYTTIGIVGGVLALLGGLWLFVSLTDDQSSGGSLPMTIILLSLLVIGGALMAYAGKGWEYRHLLPDWLQHDPPERPPTTHTVILRSSAGEESALSSQDGKLVREILAALNSAIVLGR